MKIKEFKHVICKYEDGLSNKINEMINHGWQPYGDTFYSRETQHEFSSFHQSMVKYQEEQKYETKQRNIIDFTVSYHRDQETLERIKKALIDEGWDFFKAKYDHHPQQEELKIIKLMMVKYE